MSCDTYFDKNDFVNIFALFLNKFRKNLIKFLKNFRKNKIEYYGEIIIVD